MGAYALTLLVLLSLTNCTSTEDETVFDSKTSNLDSQFVDGYRYNNVARNGHSTSSNDPVATNLPYINDGQRLAPPIARNVYGFWQSSNTATVYNCNYGNWWVAVDFTAAQGATCPYDPILGKALCTHTISEIDLFSLQDDYRTAGNPSQGTITNLYGNVDFHILYCPAGVACTSNGTGWREPPGGYVTGNNKAWTKVSFSPVKATAIRASLDCAQSTRAYVVELEAWEQQAPPSCGVPAIPRDGQSYYVGTDNSASSVVADSDRYWWQYYGSYGDSTSGCNAGSNGISDDADWVKCYIGTLHNPESAGGISVWWYFGGRAASLIQMYDLLAPIDSTRALVYLERLRQLSNAALEARDDNQWPNKPQDVYHRQIMPAWGSFNSDYGGQWVDQADMAGLFEYPMAAFARRVAANPDAFCSQYRSDAVKFTNAVMQTYTAFRGDIKWSDSANSSWAYYVGFNGVAQPYNVTLSSLRSLVEISSAINTLLYRTSSQYNSLYDYYATGEIPQLIAKNSKFFVDNLIVGDPGKAGGLSWYWWQYAKYSGGGSQNPENLNHAGLTLGSLILIWENRFALDTLLANSGHTERISNILDPTLFSKLSNTFLSRLWYYDYTPNSPNVNLVTNRIDGPYNGVYQPDQPYPLWTRGNNANGLIAGFVPLAQFNSWVWLRARDVSFNNVVQGDKDCIPGGEFGDGGLNCLWPALSEENHAALLRYRAFY